MTAFRKLAYAVLVAAAIFHYAPAVATAEEPTRGRFTLTHNVYWENALIPAGEFAFSYDPDSISPVLTLTKISGPRASFMVMVPAREESKTSDSNLLVLENTMAGSYVSAMKLPESGVTLRFHVPHPSEKRLAKAETMTATSGQ